MRDGNRLRGKFRWREYTHKSNGLSFEHSEIQPTFGSKSGIGRDGGGAGSDGGGSGNAGGGVGGK
jgi:hypothetical protein